ncbi:hypothetical protein [Microbacterium pumilum]|uniref:Uncharacterized protein n=1 Tax=Microbacterium pumilum TaxID=344165 RepID=A0ABP5DTP0_9MICO
MAERPTGHGVSPSDRRGELLTLAQGEAAARRPADLLAQWADDATVRPSQLDQRTLTRYDQLAFDSSPEYDAVLLSPVAPVGTNSVVAPTSQNRTLTTIRGSEVVSDPTNVLALECARRLRVAPREHVRLCTAHQVLRMQPVAPRPGLTRHFRLFSLADAGWSRADDGFEVAAIVAQLTVYRRLLDAAARTLGLEWERPVAVVRTDGRRPAIAHRLADALHADQPDLDIRPEALESTYYDGLRVGYAVHGRDGELREWVDLGVFDWVAQLTSNAKQRFVASAIGLQLLPQLGAATSDP